MWNKAAPPAFTSIKRHNHRLLHILGISFSKSIKFETYDIYTNRASSSLVPQPPPKRLTSTTGLPDNWKRHQPLWATNLKYHFLHFNSAQKSLKRQVCLTLSLNPNFKLHTPPSFFLSFFLASFLLSFWPPFLMTARIVSLFLLASLSSSSRSQGPPEVEIE